MTELRDIGLVDLVVVGLVVLTVVGALRRRRGILGTIGSVIGTLVVAWVASIAVTAWGPAPVVQAVRSSEFSQTFPTPATALAQLHDLDQGHSPGPSTTSTTSPGTRTP